MIATAEPITDALKSYFAHIGRKGGKTKGSCKVRGDAEYYRKLGRKSAKNGPVFDRDGKRKLN